MEKMRKKMGRTLRGVVVGLWACAATAAPLAAATIVVAAPVVVFAQATTNTLDPALTVPNGTDQSANLGAINNMGATVISFIVNVVAKVMGVGIGLWALTDFVKRDIVWGVVKAFVCGAMFFLQRIVVALGALGG